MKNMILRVYFYKWSNYFNLADLLKLLHEALLKQLRTKLQAALKI